MPTDRNPASPLQFLGEGPFRAHQVREGDAYELSNGNALVCLPAGSRHGHTRTQAAKVLDSDPLSAGAGVDVGYAFNDGKNLRSPDVSIGGEPGRPGWVDGVPPLAVEYADRGQNDRDLADKVDELLAAGTRFVWVVRLAPPVHVEVHEPGKPMVVVSMDGSLSAPGVLQNTIPARALVDRRVADRVTLDNLVQQQGYGSFQAAVDHFEHQGRQKGRQEGQQEGRLEGRQEGRQEGGRAARADAERAAADSLLGLLQARGLPVDPDAEGRVRAASLEQVLAWIVRAGTASSVAQVLADAGGSTPGSVPPAL